MTHERKPPRDTYPTDDEIAERVYEMFLERTPPSDGSADYWPVAESELLERAARRVARPRSDGHNGK